jgi:hypothetical protein
MVTITKQTLVALDIEYLSFYLKDKDTIAATTLPTDISSANSIVLRLRLEGEATNSVNVPCSIVTGTLGYCKAMVTIPAVTDNTNCQSEVEVFFSNGEIITWIGNTYVIVPELG